MELIENSVRVSGRVEARLLGYGYASSANSFRERIKCQAHSLALEDVQ